MDVDRKRSEEKSLKVNLETYEEMAEWLKATDCKSVGYSHRRFESYFLQFQ